MQLKLPVLTLCSSPLSAAPSAGSTVAVRSLPLLCPIYTPEFVQLPLRPFCSCLKLDPGFLLSQAMPCLFSWPQDPLSIVGNSCTHCPHTCGRKWEQMIPCLYKSTMCKVWDVSLTNQMCVQYGCSEKRKNSVFLFFFLSLRKQSNLTYLIAPLKGV